MYRKSFIPVALLVLVGPLLPVAVPAKPDQAGAVADNRPAPYKILSVSRVGAPAQDKGPPPEVVVQSGHSQAVRAVAFHPSGGLLATASNDATVKLWDTRQGREIRTFLGADQILSSVAFRPDGKQIAAGGAGPSIYVWNVPDGSLAAVLKGHTDWVEDLAFSPDGKSLATAGSDKVVAVWDLENGLPVHVLKHDGPVCHLAWSPDGKTLSAVTTGPRAFLWDTATGERVHTVAFPVPKEQGPAQGDGPVFSWRVGFSPDGKSWVVSISGRTHVFDAGSRKALRVLAGTFLSYRRQDGAVCLLEKAGTVRFVHPVTGEPAGKATIKVDAAAREFGFGDRDLPELHSVLSSDGQLLACPVSEGRVGVWDTRSGGLIQFLGSRTGSKFAQFRGNLLRPMTVAWSPTAPVFATADMDHVRVIDLRTGAAPHVVLAQRAIPALAFSPDGKVLATGGSADKKIKLWESDTGRLLTTCDFAGLAGPVHTLRFAPSGKVLVSGHRIWFGGNKADCAIIVWDAASGKRLHVLTNDEPSRPQEGPLANASLKVSGLAFRDNVLYSTHDYQNLLSSWDIKTGKRLSAWVVNGTTTNGLAFSPDGRLLAVAGGTPRLLVRKDTGVADQAIRLYQTRPGKWQGFLLRGHDQMALAVAFSPDGKVLASAGSDATIRFWDPRKKTLLATLTGHTSDVGALAFSHDGRFLASAGDDHAVCLWDVAQRKLAATFVGFGPEAFVLVTPENRYTASRHGLKGVAFRLGNRAVPFEQFDLQFNRPDIVLERLGYASAELLRAYRTAYQKRLRRMKIAEDRAPGNFNLATLELLAQPPLSTRSRRLTVRLRAADGHARLERLLGSVNDVPLWGVAGADLRSLKASSADLEVPIELSPGTNVVKLSVVNSKGTESLLQTFQIRCQAPARKPDLYILAVGVADYKNPAMRLTYADKDARDLSSFFQNKKDRFRAVYVKQLLNRDATRENILKAREFFRGATVDDEVIVLFAGHGLLDHKTYAYYFGTVDVDFKNPAGRGLPYEDMEALLHDVRARRKLLLMDTCHAGEVDPEDGRPAGSSATTADGKVTARGFRGLDFSELRRLGVRSTGKLLEELFADLRQGTGTVVIAASGGLHHALESSRWQNGVFTYAVLQGLSGKADKNRDGSIHVSELREYVLEEVRRLTNGRQAPTVRRENLEFDFPIY